ncbi:DNA recombination protein RmuC [Pseudoxanthomonas sp. F37]|uniref:DNA recombination protein RmuC n=1 Tax=Pseudoxanthomonas sp. F37 TaxID=2932492 RepID=UPI001FD0D9FA|nr:MULTISPECIES: DNA recombination protein RmuC [Pseudoxanthomonas]UOV03825.1 DNA recombination protein RmuC [Pseudoxanthomonas mexicana]UOV08819.1 DNA recombination protein RmuC [Pseudoxanthomonas sp. F37]
MDSQTLLVLLSILVAIAVVLLAVLVLRRPEARIGDLLERALRDEQREGRSELREQLEGLSRAQEVRIDGFARSLADLSTRTDQRLDVLRDTLSEDARKGRLDASESQQRFADALGQRLNELTQRNEQRIGEMRATLEGRLKELQADNAQKLEQMRATVDEKLQATLTQRLDASFSLVSERLEAVQRGLGEMQQLATGVGDLKRVLTNVKDRGGWGEVQLENLLEQVLTAEQFASSVKVRPDSNEAVDFAIRLPGRQDGEVPVWLPIDAKFPREDYERLIDAQERGDADAMRIAATQLERAIKVQAKSINEKYVVPPHTTDFAVLFLATEGLYAEAIRRPGLVDTLQRDHRIVIAGPTTLAALLNSLQMGFRTLAIEKRSSEVRVLLGAVKTEFGKFATVLEKAHSQLDTVQNSIKQAGVRTRAIERQLRGVEALPGEESQKLLGGDEAE